MMIKQKTFVDALNNLHAEPKKTKKYLEDKRLTTVEKKILSCWYMLKNCQHTEIIDTILSITSKEDDLVESQKYLILGMTYNNQGDYDKAIVNILKGIDLLEPYPLEVHRFIACYNLFVCYYNQNNGEGMKSTLDRLMKLKMKTPRQDLCIVQAKINYHIFKNEFEEAEDLFSVAEKSFDLMTDAMIMTHWISKFIMLSKLDDFNHCGKVLEEMKKYRLFRSSATFTYMRTLLDHVTKKEPIYVYKEDFKQSELLFYQLKTIQALEENDLLTAKKNWDQLVMMSPFLHGPDFHYRGEKNLFVTCLNMYKTVYSVASDIVTVVELPENKVEALITLLKASKTPIRKEVIFDKLWGGDMMNTSDDHKLKNLMYYARKHKGINIQFRKGCYFISETDEQSAA